MRTEERVSISAFVDPDDHERLVERAHAEDRSLSAAVRCAIREYVADRPRRTMATVDADEAEATWGR